MSVALPAQARTRCNTLPLTQNSTSGGWHGGVAAHELPCRHAGGVEQAMAVMQDTERGAGQLHSAEAASTSAPGGQRRAAGLRVPQQRWRKRATRASSWRPPLMWQTRSARSTRPASGARSRRWPPRSRSGGGSVRALAAPASPLPLPFCSRGCVRQLATGYLLGRQQQMDKRCCTASMVKQVASRAYLWPSGVQCDDRPTLLCCLQRRRRRGERWIR